MNHEQFLAILPYICEDLINLIAAKQQLSEEEALSRLYSSELYAVLEQEDTKLWQYSTPMLYALFAQEQTSGQMQFPDV